MKESFSIRSFDQKRCIFVHITKSAGTSVAKSLFTELPNHYTAQQYQIIFGKKDFHNYFKFAFVRNPWDRLYSAYSYLKGGGWNKSDQTWFTTNLAQYIDFNEFVLEWLTPKHLHEHIHFWPQSRFICDNKGTPLLNYLGYFETLPEDFEHICKTIHIPGKLQHINASKRKSYKDVYSALAIERVAQIYNQDIENFGYSFDSVRKRSIQDGHFINL